MDIREDIQEAIAKQLPAQVGEVLRVRLEQAEKDAKANVSLTNMNNEQRREIQQLEARIAKRDAELKRAGDLDARAADLDTRERNMKIATLEIQLAAADSKVAFAKDLAMGLVRNTEFRSSVYEQNTGRGVPVPSGSYLAQAGTETTTGNTTTVAS